MAEIDSGLEPATVELVVKLVPEAMPGSVEHAQLLAGAAALGITLEPVDPTGADPELATYHLAVLPTQVAARAADQLRQLDVVEAAYTRPRGEPPTEGSTP